MLNGDNNVHGNKSVVLTSKRMSVNTYLISDMSLHFRDRRGATSLR